jgi:hypothetical protein
MDHAPATHDSTSTQDEKETRIAACGPWGTRMRMAKACGAAALLTEGVPMFLAGAEAGETQPFYFDVPTANGARSDLPLGNYERMKQEDGKQEPANENGKVLAWYRALLELRKDWSNGLASDDVPWIGEGNRTVSFTRDGGRFFVVVTFGTGDRQQNLGWLGLPHGAVYKEVINSTSGAFHVDNDETYGSGGPNGGGLTDSTVANLPSIGALVLERM